MILSYFVLHVAIVLPHCRAFSCYVVVGSLIDELCQHFRQRLFLMVDKSKLSVLVTNYDDVQSVLCFLLRKEVDEGNHRYFCWNDYIVRLHYGLKESAAVLREIQETKWKKKNSIALYFGDHAQTR